MLLAILITLETLLIIRGVLILLNSKPEAEKAKSDNPLAVVIPLKGWDHAFPNLIENLLNQNLVTVSKIIIVIDSDNPNYEKIKKDKRVILLNSKPLPKDWSDKNWRLYQGVEQVLTADIMLLDSDVCIDRDFLAHRTKNHEGDLSYSIPLYRKPCNSPERFLASFTNYNNFQMYKVNSMISHLGTAVGPSIFVTAGKEILLKALYQNKNEIADDHSLGHWFAKNHYRLTCSQEPIYVMKDKAGWEEVLDQIKRWLILPRTVLHLLTPSTTILFGIYIALNSISTAAFYTGFFKLCTGNFFTGSIILSASALYFLTESLILFAAEIKYTKRVHSFYPWSHFIFLPLMLIVQPFLLAYTLFCKKVVWRDQHIIIR